jgi:MarR family transcriptional regulator, organic hydroperoxide resistance regulator
VTDRTLIASLEATVHRVLDHLAVELADLDLSHAEINALAALRPGAARAVRELVPATGQRPSTLTGVLDRLERKRLVRRRVNPTDRRSFTVELTAAGEAAAARIHGAFEALDARVLGDVPPTAAEGFHYVLDTLERHTTGQT